MVNFFRKNSFLINNFAILVAWHCLLFIDKHLFAIPLFIIGMYVCTVLPGTIAVIALGAKRLSFQTLLFVVGLSFVFMLLVGLSANYVPHLFGVLRPLSFSTVIISFDLWLLLVCLWTLNVENKFPSISMPILKFNYQTVVVYLIVTVGIALCVLGTFRLNNGVDNLISIFGFILLIINVLLVFYWRNKLPNHAYLITIIGLSTGLLLVTSLRSNFISGQDLKQEFRVYNITNNASYWSIANFRDSYNACLSITLYPYTLVKLLGVSAETVFKLVYQLIFVVCPLAVFLILKFKLGRNLALAGTIFFLSLPTVGIDLPLQTRQQMAFVLFSLIILAWFNHSSEVWIKRHWQSLFIMFSFASIVSHYSTAYIYIGTLLIYCVLRFILLTTKYAKHRQLSEHFVLSGRIILLVFLFAFFWLGQVTAVSANLIEKLRPAVSSLIGTEKQDSSPTISVEPLKGQKNPLYGYIIHTKSEGAPLTQETYRQVFPVNDTLKPAYPLDKLPGNAQKVLMVISQKLYYVVGIIIYPIIIILGLGVLIFRKERLKHSFTQKPEYVIVSIAIISVLIIQAILPGINADYGLPRAFIQAFIILCLPFMFGVKSIIRMTRFQKSAKTAVVFSSILMFCTYSGLTGQLIGGLRPQLNFNNAGPYYGAFYVRRNDVEAYKWIEANIVSPGNVSAPDYSFPTALAYYPKYRHYGGGIFPFQEHFGNYTLLNYPQTYSDFTYTTGSVVAVKLNVRSYDNVNTVYSNKYSRLYK